MTRRTKTACGAAALVLGLAVGDAIAAQRRVQPGQRFELAHAAAADLADSGLEVRFQGVLEDSRCPENARCMWAGNARVELGIGAEGEAGESLVLNTHGGEALPSTGCVAGLQVELLGLQPCPSTEGPPATDQYVVTLVARVGCAQETGGYRTGGVRRTGETSRKGASILVTAGTVHPRRLLARALLLAPDRPCPDAQRPGMGYPRAGAGAPAGRCP